VPERTVAKLKQQATSRLLDRTESSRHRRFFRQWKWLEPASGQEVNSGLVLKDRGIEGSGLRIREAQSCSLVVQLTQGDGFGFFSKVTEGQARKERKKPCHAN
jgi:hypothetical protein